LPTSLSVLPTQLIKEDKERVLRVRMLQQESAKGLEPVYLFDEGQHSLDALWAQAHLFYPGMQMFYGPDVYYGRYVSVPEVDGQFKLEEVSYIETHQ